MCYYGISYYSWLSGYVLSYKVWPNFYTFKIFIVKFLHENKYFKKVVSHAYQKFEFIF